MSKTCEKGREKKNEKKKAENLASFDVCCCVMDIGSEGEIREMSSNSSSLPLLTRKYP